MSRVRLVLLALGIVGFMGCHIWGTDCLESCEAWVPLPGGEYPVANGQGLNGIYTSGDLSSLEITDAAGNVWRVDMQRRPDGVTSATRP